MIKSIVVPLLISILLTPTYGKSRVKISAPPSIWVHQEGDRLTGPIIDLLDQIFVENEVVIESKPLPWARAITDMRSGDLDIIPVIFHTKDREQFMEYTLPYAEVPTSVFVPKGRAFPFNSLEDLKGREGVMMTGDRISDQFAQIKSSLNITGIVKYEDMLEMLVSHRADYVIAAKYGLLIEAKQLGVDDKIEILPTPVSNNKLYFAISKKSSYLPFVSKINEKIERMRKDGSLEKVIETTIDKFIDQDRK